MALIANYTDLQNALLEWLGRVGDVTPISTRLPQFIANFESEFVLDPEMRTLDMEQVDTLAVASASVPLPVSFIEMIRLKGVAVNNGADQEYCYVSPSQAAGLDQVAQSITGGPGVSK